MKKRLIRALCLALCLFLPVSALGEPLAWLEPLARRTEQENIQAVITGKVFSANVLELLNENLDAQIERTRDYTEDWAWRAEQTRAQVREQRAQYAQKVPAAAARLRACAVTVVRAPGVVTAEVAVSGEPWFSLTLVLSPDGDTLLLSDLFPSFALRLDRVEEAMRGASLAALGDALGAVAAHLPDYVDYPLMEQLLSAFSAGLQELSAQGAAERTADGLTYGVTEAFSAEEAFDARRDDALWARLSAGEHTDPQITWLFRALNALLDVSQSQGLAARQDAERGVESGAVLSSSIPVSAEIARQYSFSGGALACADQETQYSKNVNRDGMFPEEGPGYPHTTAGTWRIAPDGLSFRAENIGWPESLEELTAAWTADEIRADYRHKREYSGREDENTRVSLRLRRGETGRTAALDVTGRFRSYAGDSLTLRTDALWDNDLTGLDLSLSVLQEDGPLTLGSLEGALSYPAKPKAAPDLAAVTVLSTTDPAQEYSAFYAELRAVAIPKLNRLILTGLPNNAQPLTADLLAIIDLLGSAMQ